jgi:AraC-like DNA-binding protein
MQKIVFSSDALAPELDDRERFSHWRDFMIGLHGALDITRAPDRPFSQRMEVAQFGEVGMMRSRGTTDRMTRTSRTIAAARSQDFFYALNRGRGAMSLSQLGREAVFDSGTAVFGHGAEAGEFRATGFNAFDMLAIPHARLRELVGDAEDRVARPLPLPRNGATTRYLQLYINFVSTLDGVDDDPALPAHIGRTLTDLVAVALGANGDALAAAEAGGIRAARLHAVKADIRARLDRDGLSVGTVAARHGVGPRYVQALFESEGTTFSEFVRAERLQRVYRRLADPRTLHRSIGDLAFEVGFGDLSHFNRAFRRRYGLAPSDVRATAIRKRGR